MGTSGYMAFVLDGETKAGYVNNDSYPEGLGVDILTWLHEAYSKPETYRAVQALTVVDDDSAKPTAEQQAALVQYSDLHVSHQSMEDWYCLLRKCQGDPVKTIESGYIYGDHRVTPYSPGYFGEYTYIIDFDAKEFRASGYGDELGRWKFGDLPTTEAFLATATEDED